MPSLLSNTFEVYDDGSDSDGAEEQDDESESYNTEESGEESNSDYEYDWDCDFLDDADEQDSAFVEAANRGNLEGMKKILQPYDEPDEEESSNLFLSMKENKMKMLNGARKWTEVQEKCGYDKSWTWFGDTALIAAARNGHFNVVKFLLLEGADPTLVSCPTDDQYENAVQAAEKSKRLGHSNAIKTQNLLNEAMKYWVKARYAGASHSKDREKAYTKKEVGGFKAFAYELNQPSCFTSLKLAITSL